MIPAFRAQPIFLMSSSLTADVIESLKPHPGVNLFITAGNSMRGDDGVGPFFADLIKEIPGISVIDAGMRPENIMDEAIGLHPDYLICVDAAHFGAQAGEVRVLSEAEISELSYSTHTIPLSVVAKIIAASTQAKVTYIGIQPKTVALGQTLSSEAMKTAQEMASFIRNAYANSPGD